MASLWLVIAWPALEALVYRPDRHLVLHWTRQWFLALLLAMEAFNVLGTRRALAGLMWVAAQTILLHQQLPFLNAFFARTSPDGAFVPNNPSLRLFANLPLLAVALLTASVALTAVDWPRRRKQPADSWTAAWLDFRDEFGTIWSLRVAERFNSAAALCHWNLRLRWAGPAPADANLPPDRFDTLPAARLSLLQLLRRFVSPDWLAQRGVDAAL